MNQKSSSIQRIMLGGKIHRATVTAADLHYVGSITIDRDLMRAANIIPFERVQVVDVTNGARLETYAIAGESGSGIIQLNGAAAHLVHVNDIVIIMSYVNVTDPQNWHPPVVLVDEKNRITEVVGMHDLIAASNQHTDAEVEC